MADGGRHHALRYSAFISYSHHDTVFARRLQRQLETYRLPRRVSGIGNVPFEGRRQLRPVFRDREELAAAPDVDEALREAIGQASFLIVVCSANAAGSAWVAREVALFEALHGAHAILAAVAPGSSPEFINPVLHGAAACHESLQPLAADFRQEGDGARLALMKLVAVLAGVRLDDLVQRDAQRRIRAIGFVSLGAFAGMAVMTVMAAVAVSARHAAEHERARGETLIGYMLTDLRRGLKAVGRLDLLDTVNRGVAGYFGGQDLSRMNDTELKQRAKLLQAMGEDDSARGKLDQARVWFEQAKRTTEVRLSARPGDLERTFDDSQSEYWVGYIDWLTGHTKEAEEHFKSYAALVDRLVQAQPDNPRWLAERGYADSNLGMFLMRHALDLAHAEPLFMEALAALRSAAGRQEYDPDMQVQIADGYGWLGDLERLRRNYPRARDYRRRQSGVLDEVLGRDQRNAEARTKMVSVDLGLARIDLESGVYDTALRELADGRALAAGLAKEDPDDVSIRAKVRALDLFRIQAEVSRRPASRAGDTILDEIGDCTKERAVLKSNELAAFCTVIRARRLQQDGETASARAALSLTIVRSAIGDDALTQSWGLDLRTALKEAQGETVSPGEARK